MECVCVCHTGVIIKSLVGFKPEMDKAIAATSEFE